MTLRWKPKHRQTRLVYADGEALHRCDVVEVNPNKVFDVVGPFDGHMDKMDLQRSLEFVLRGYNLHSESSKGRKIAGAVPRMPRKRA